MADPSSVPPRCPLCPRVRRGDRPLCNHHMRKCGQPHLDAYFVQVREANGKPANHPAVLKLGATIDAMLDSARRYDQIRKTGYRPFWNVGLARWEHPVTRARGILESYVANHRFGLDADNDMTVIDRIVSELVPPLP